MFSFLIGGSVVGAYVEVFCVAGRLAQLSAKFGWIGVSVQNWVMIPFWL